MDQTRRGGCRALGLGGGRTLDERDFGVILFVRALEPLPHVLNVFIEVPTDHFLQGDYLLNAPRFRYCPARPHFSHDRRTVSAGYSRSCSEPPDIVAHSLRASIALMESVNPTTKYLCVRKLVPSRQHVQRNLLSDSQCAHSRPQFISVMWPDLGWGRTEERAVLSCGKSTARSFL